MFVFHVYSIIGFFMMKLDFYIQDILLIQVASSEKA